MAQVYITRRIPERAEELLRAEGHEVTVSEKEGALTRAELLEALREKPYDAVISLLTDTIDGEVFDAVPSAKIFANYAVGFNNIDLVAAKERGVVVTNTPGTLTDTVAEHAIGMMLALTSRLVEGDRFMRAGKYGGWEPMLLLGMDVRGKTLGLVGAGHIGIRTAEIAHKGLGMHIVYTDVAEVPELHTALQAKYVATVEELIAESDVVSLHVPLLPSTRHLMNEARLGLLKKSAYLINTSRGPVIDESALVRALEQKSFAGAALDVFENEPALAPGLVALENVLLTPHIASATEGARLEMAEIAVANVVAVLKGEAPLNPAG